MVDFTFLEGSPAAYEPVDGDGAVPGTIVEVRDDAPDQWTEDSIRVVLEREDGTEVDTARERVEVLS